uniref:Uncharacterized protein n=1 Tax=Helianthus annuus TaxID=4232 RepID=A0A251U8A1_HELAN
MWVQILFQSSLYRIGGTLVLLQFVSRIRYLIEDTMGICFSEYILDAKSQLHANGIIKVYGKEIVDMCFDRITKLALRNKKDATPIMQIADTLLRDQWKF